MRIWLRPLGLLALALLTLTPLLEAQRPELNYYRFNETSGVLTTDLATPGLTGVSAIVTNGANFNNNLQILGAGCVNTQPATGVPVQTNKKISAAGSWSIEIWAFEHDLTDPSALRYLFGEQTANSLRCFRGGIAGANNIAFRMTGMNDVFIANGSTYNAWNHLAFVYDSLANTVTPYLNGAPLPAVQQNNPLPIAGTAAAGWDIGGYNTNVPWYGLIDEFRFWDRALSAAEIAAQYNIQLKNNNDDVAVSAIVSPLGDQTGCNTLSSSETIQFEIENTGLNALPAGTTFSATYTINGGSPVTESFSTTTTSLTTAQREVFSFVTPANLAAIGNYTIDVSVAYALDLIVANDTNTRVASSGGATLITSFPWTETFDSLASDGTQVPPAGWRQDLTDGTGVDADWYFRSTATPTGGTGPATDRSGSGFYAYVEDDGNEATINLISPCLDLGAVTSPRVKFYVHSNNPQTPTGDNFVSLDIIAFPGGVVSTDVLGPLGPLGSAWTEYFIDIPAFSGQTVQLQFRGRTDGGAATNDIALDDVSVFNFVPGAGQAPRSGIAMLDINSANSPGLSSIQSLDNGPYTTRITGGERITFSFIGEANRPVVLLFGSLNVGAASYGAVGQLDIGGPVGTTGVPSGILLFGDGNQPSGFNVFFNTGPAGSSSIYFTMPFFPTGVLTTFQGILPWVGGVAISNAVEVTIY
ncbi:MAG: hypothetical protein H6807_03175 [Planctomycetes bacterium]|nr:hypothetical protein [Planctomycetota bacterium]